MDKFDIFSVEEEEVEGESASMIFIYASALF